MKASDRTRPARLESGAQWRAEAAAVPVPDRDYDAFARAFGRRLVEEPDFREGYQTAFAALWAREHPGTEGRAR